jgi:hypothetical protein
MATPATTRVDPETTVTPTLLVALALGGNPGQLGGTTGAAPRPRVLHLLRR